MYLRAVSVRAEWALGDRVGVGVPVPEPLPGGWGGPGAKGVLRGSRGSWGRPLRGPPPPAVVARVPRHFPPHLIRLECRGCAAEQ